MYLLRLSDIFGTRSIEVGLKLELPVVKMFHIKTFLLWIFLTLTFDTTKCWDTDDLELFDLVEEVNANFYDVLGLSRVRIFHADSEQLGELQTFGSYQLFGYNTPFVYIISYKFEHSIVCYHLSF